MPPVRKKKKFNLTVTFEWPSKEKDDILYDHGLNLSMLTMLTTSQISNPCGAPMVKYAVIKN